MQILLVKLLLSAKLGIKYDQYKKCNVTLWNFFLGIPTVIESFRFKDENDGSLNQ